MKMFQVVISERVQTETRKKLKRILKPVTSVSNPGNCELCGTMTTWTINNRLVCPACHVLYGFWPKDSVPDPCEVCGRQGEWCTEGDPIHSLCYIHRDAWFHWQTPELAFVDHKKQPEKWYQVWEEGWARFVTFMKGHENT